ncbi:permease prefix domain 2-containing transporter [Splendidivirga corallicola]|uniref:permease prefix domain 2-containing transporter n=1 Tax=Splendidivirga corallicola TaxID=3051826 RepID=UPI003D29CBD0
MKKIMLLKSTTEHLPPKLAQRLLRMFVRKDICEEILGDLDEKFCSMLKKKSLFRTRLNYWYQVCHYIRHFAIGQSWSIN